jgi:hypothetical protein
MGELAEELDYLDLQKDYNDTLMKIERDQFGRFVENNYQSKLFPRTGIEEGWYQDSKGSLYHYDGLIWDEVPNPNIKQLEYLG